jgi:hypothetical protein
MRFEELYERQQHRTVEPAVRRPDSSPVISRSKGVDLFGYRLSEAVMGVPETRVVCCATRIWQSDKTKGRGSMILAPWQPLPDGGGEWQGAHLGVATSVNDSTRIPSSYIEVSSNEHAYASIL